MKYAGIGFYLITPLLLGIFIGLYIDAKFGTKPIFTLVGIGLGVILTFVNLIKVTRN
jgi:ATP synthase protein I